jgi:hypothetical protein
VDTCKAPQGGTRLAQLLKVASKEKNRFASVKAQPSWGASEWSSWRMRHELVQDGLLIDNPELSVYFARLTAQLLTPWTSAALSAPPVTVFVRSSDDPCAYTERGSITLCTGLLRQLKSEDAVAAIMAHELGHVLMKQDEKPHTAITIDLLVEASGLLLSSKEASREPQGASAGGHDLVALGATQLGSVAWSDLLHPTHNREDERAADELGTDLLRGSGFDPAPGFDEVFPLLKEASASRSERMKLLQALVVERLNAAAGRRIGNQNSLSAVTQIVNLAQAAFFHETDELGKAYDTSQIRSDSRGAYERATADCAPQSAPGSPSWDGSEFAKLFGNGGAVSQLFELDAAAGRLSASVRSISSPQPQTAPATDVATSSLTPNRGPNIAALNVPGARRPSTRNQKAPSNAHSPTPQPARAPTALSPAERDYQLLVANMDQLQPRALFVASGYALTKNDVGTAVRLLTRLTAMKTAPPSAYIALADIQRFRLNQPAEALATLSQGQKKLNAWRPFLVELTATAKAAKDALSAERYATICECQAHRKAADDIGPGFFLDFLKKQREATLYDQCTTQLGYDVRTPEVRMRVYQYHGGFPSFKDVHERMAWRNEACASDE